MKASDTVMSKEEQARVWLKAEQGEGFLEACDLLSVLTNPDLFSESEQFHSQATATRQAEITWKACIKEVVEWVKQNLVDEDNPVQVGNTIYLRFRAPIDTTKWQAELKKLGV